MAKYLAVLSLVIGLAAVPAIDASASGAAARVASRSAHVVVVTRATEEIDPIDPVHGDGDDGYTHTEATEIPHVHAHGDVPAIVADLFLAFAALVVGVWLWSLVAKQRT